MDFKIVESLIYLNDKVNSYRKKQSILFTLDIFIITISSIVSMKLLEMSIGNKEILSIIIYASFNIISFCIFSCYSSLWNCGGGKEIANIFIASIFSALFFALICELFKFELYPLFYILNALMVIFFIVGSRVSYRTGRRILLQIDMNKNQEIKKVLIIGAGSAGKLVIRELYSNADMNKMPVGVVDDDIRKVGKSVYGVPVLGKINEIEKIVKEKQIDEIIFSIANIPKERKVEIIEKCKETKCKLKTIPGIYEIIDGKVDIKQIRDVEIEDLLGRDVVETNLEEISEYLNEKIVLVTGGGGSIGSELCRQIVKFSPKKLIILDIYENNAYAIQQELVQQYGNEINLEVLISSVRDKSRVYDIMRTYRPDVVFHAAAHKHVPLMEKSPCEAVKNNIFGTINVIGAADMCKVKKFVLISTDKAVNPTNIMGATKRCCEIMIQSLNEYSKTEFVAVRFGNVLGSNGSVIPLFKKQIEEGGPVRVTHPEITRYFMTIPEAVSLVIEAGSMAKGGEIFVLDMGKSVKIADLAKNLIALSGLELGVDIDIEYTGLRPGEKLYEELLLEEEGLKNTSNKKIFIGEPIHISRKLLTKNVNELKVAVNYNDDEKVRKIMKNIVTTYVEAENVDKEEQVAATI